MKRTTINISLELHEALRKEAFKRGQSMSSLVRELVEAKLQAIPKKTFEEHKPDPKELPHLSKAFKRAESEIQKAKGIKSCKHGAQIGLCKHGCKR